MNTLEVVIQNPVNCNHAINIILFILFERKGIEVTEEVVLNLLRENLRVLGISGIEDLHKNYEQEPNYDKILTRANKLARIIFPELFRHENNTETYLRQLA